MRILALGLAAACLLIAVLYFVGVLQIGTTHPGRHVSHAVLFAVLSALCVVWSRFAGNAPAKT